MRRSDHAGRIETDGTKETDMIHELKDVPKGHNCYELYKII